LGRTPRELACSITSREFTWLRAFTNLEPFGFEVENYRAGVIASTVARAHGAKVKPSDFYPKPARRQDERAQTKAEQIQILMAAGRRTEGDEVA